jgi:murein L,D-transpeptidase YafK
MSNDPRSTPVPRIAGGSTRERWRRSAKVAATVIAAVAVCVVGGLAGMRTPAVVHMAAAGGGARADRILIEKQAHRMTLLRRGAVLRTYRVALGSGGLERKLRQGDARVPEGLYRIDSRNPHSPYHLALHVSYPNAADLARARAAAVAPGGDIMIHGLPDRFAAIGRAHVLHDWTLGCIAVTDSEIEEVWQLVPDGCGVEIRP